MKKMLVQTHFFSIALLLSVASGCSKNDEKSTFVFVEYVEVSGTCKEDHANKSGKYFGSLVHWYDAKTNIHDRYGSVSTWTPDANLADDAIEQIENPNKYFPPDNIDFDTVPEAMFNSPLMQIKGVSSDISLGDTGANSGFQSTCLLQATKRLDHLPETNIKSQGKTK